MTLDECMLKYKQWQAAHPKLAGLIVVAESTAVGAATDVLANGFDFSRQGLKHAATIIVTAVILALRNYLKSNAKDLQRQFESKPEIKPEV